MIELIGFPAFWSILWLFSWAGNLLFRKVHISYVQRVEVLIFYYITLMVANYIFFLNYLPKINKQEIFIVCIFWIILILINAVKIQKHHLNTLQKYFMEVKIFEIEFQQIFIIALANYVIGLDYSYFVKLLIFSIFFGLTHVPILFVKQLDWLRFLLLKLSFIGGFVFVFLITYFENGYYYTYMLHYLFYLVLSYYLTTKLIKMM